MTATQKARALLAQYHAAKATYESPDPHDREEDVALVEALLAAVDDERAAGDAEGYARAMREVSAYASQASSLALRDRAYSEASTLEDCAEWARTRAEVPRG